VDGVATMVGRVVVFVQENHTTDNYFRQMREYGANVAADWPLQPNPPTHDQPHTRAAYARWLPPNTPGRCRQLKARYISLCALGAAGSLPPTFRGVRHHRIDTGERNAVAATVFAENDA